MYGPEATSGIGVYIKNLTDQLFLIDQKNEYILFMLEPAYSSFQPPSQRVKKIKVACPWYSFSEQLKLPPILLKYNLDLVHFPHFNVPIFYPKKFIVTIHDITPKFFPGPRVKKSAIRKLGYEAVFRLGSKRAKKIISVSNHTKENLIKFFHLPSEKIAVIYPGLDPQFKIINDDSAKQAIKNLYQITKPFIFYLGPWRDHKNLPSLIAAFNLLKAKGQFDYQLVLGGKPDPNYPEIKRAIEDSKFRSEIISPGYISDQDLPLFYNAAELFVLPSLAEGFGLVALESLACGTPVVASKTTSLPEVLQEAAIYFDPKNPSAIASAIYQVLTDSSLYDELKNRGLNQAKKYRWRTGAEKTLAIYQSS